MKKFIILVIVFSVCIFPFSIAYAAPTTYSINEENMKITIPDGWDVFTQDTDVNDKRLKKYGLDERFLSEMITNNACLEALYQKPFTEMNVGSLSNDSTEVIYNFKALNDSNMEVVTKTFLKKFEEARKVKIVDRRIYSSSNAKYIVFHYEDNSNEKKINAVQYYTVVNGQMFTITLYSMSGTISDKMEGVIKSVVDSLTYIEKPNPHPETLASMQAGTDATATNQASAKPSSPASAEPSVVASAEPSAAVSSEPSVEDSTLPVLGDAASKSPDTALYILIVLGGCVVVALIIARIVKLVNKKDRSEYDSREIVISSDGYNTDTPDNSGGFIPPEPTERSSPWDMDNTEEVRAAQPDVTQETEEGYQTDETSETDAMDQGDATEAPVFCNQCGAKAPENSRFCYRCGAPINKG